MPRAPSERGNKWSEVFPRAACTVTLVARLVHSSETFEMEG